MNVEAMNSIIKRFLKQDNKEKCLIFDGPWGVGKTFEINSYLKDNTKDYKYIYISVFGLTSLQELQTKVVESMSKLGKTITGVSKIISMFSNSEKANITMRTCELFGFIVDNLKRSKLKFCFVFDDLERIGTGLSYLEIFSAIEQLIINDENDNIKVISVVNSEKIKKDSLDSYNDYKEKICDEYYKIEYSNQKVIKKLLDFGIKELKVYDVTKKAIAKYHLNNLRTFKKINWFIKRLQDKYEGIFYGNHLKVALNMIVLMVFQVEDKIFKPIDFDKMKKECKDDMLYSIKKNKFKNYAKFEDFKAMCDNFAKNNIFNDGTFDFNILFNLYKEYIFNSSDLKTLNEEKIISEMTIDQKLEQTFYNSYEENDEMLKDIVNSVNDNTDINSNNIFSYLNVIAYYYELQEGYKCKFSFNLDDYKNILVKKIATIIIDDKHDLNFYAEPIIDRHKPNDDCQKEFKLINNRSYDNAINILLIKIRKAYEEKDFESLLNAIMIYYDFTKIYTDETKIKELFNELLCKNDFLVISPLKNFERSSWEKYVLIYKFICKFNTNYKEKLINKFNNLATETKDVTIAYRCDMLVNELNKIK